MEISVPSTVTVPGDLAISATVGALATSGDVTGFVVLTHGSDSRRIPFWVEVDHPSLAGEKAKTLKAPGLYNATTLGGERKVNHYRYPTSGDGYYPGPEVVYRVTITRPIANFGVAVVSGKAVPHVVYAGDENHLVGYPGLPEVLNPYFRSFGESRPVAGAVLPGPGKYDIVFDTRSAAAAGKFEFRLGERHAAAQDPRRVDEERPDHDLCDRCWSRRRSAIDHRHARRPQDHTSVRERVAVDARHSWLAHSDRELLRLSGAEEHGGRREDQGEHGDTDAYGRVVR